MEKSRRRFTQCPNCGQENHDLNVPVKYLLCTLHYGTRFWATLRHLHFRPGLLTEEFDIGQRASYVPPFRLYVFVSLVFFFVLSRRASHGIEIQNVDLPPIEVPAVPEVRLADSLLYARDATVITPDFASDSAVQTIKNLLSKWL